MRGRPSVHSTTGTSRRVCTRSCHRTTVLLQPGRLSHDDSSPMRDHALRSRSGHCRVILGKSDNTSIIPALDAHRRRLRPDFLSGRHGHGPSRMSRWHADDTSINPPRSDPGCRCWWLDGLRNATLVRAPTTTRRTTPIKTTRPSRKRFRRTLSKLNSVDSDDKNSEPFFSRTRATDRPLATSVPEAQADRKGSGRVWTIARSRIASSLEPSFSA